MLDDLDRAIAHALHIDGRAPFNRIAAVLGVSDQTVARRYQRLRSGGLLRVVGQPVARRLDWGSSGCCVSRQFHEPPQRSRTRWPAGTTPSGST
ncbi:Lrp/AsnC family transcriptional regulator [Kribbella sp. NPDC050241]|uniref:Lrp/AsnC family transcriptional regulator n=1 Tax=Kribbella sp. NPDC050241 TaxID=3364115 RepID=UPI0037ADDF80